MAVIDTHTHVIASDEAKYPIAPLGGHRSNWSVARPVSHDELVRAMDGAGVDQAVVVQASTVYGHDNSYVLEAVRAHPARLVGVYSVDVLVPDAVEALERWRDTGLFGFRLFTTGSTMPGQASWLDDPASYPAWEWAQEQGAPICLQMTAEGLPALAGMLERFPQVRVLLDHLARPELSDGPPYSAARSLFDMARFPGVHLKLTNRTLAAASAGASTPGALVRQVVDRFGAERVAWGSNFPAAEGALSDLLGAARRALADLPADQQAMIFAGTAQRIYPGLKAAAHA